MNRRSTTRLRVGRADRRAARGPELATERGRGDLLLVRTHTAAGGRELDAPDGEVEVAFCAAVLRRRLRHQHSTTDITPYLSFLYASISSISFFC